MGIHALARKKRWSMTPEAFRALLAALDPDWERAGERYEEIRRSLVCFFQWRGCTSPEDHADETFNRVARKIEEGEVIRDPASYFHGVARLLLLELFKSQTRERNALSRMSLNVASDTDKDTADLEEARLNSLRRCLGKLPPESRHFITQYYQGEKRAKIEGRLRLAEQMRIPLNALRLRARRLREKLEICVQQGMKRSHF